LQKHGAPRFVILGGSFNPVHAGHVELARALSGSPGVAQVLAIPAALNPFKSAERLLPARTRWEMARAAFADLPKVAVLDVELRRGPPSFTVDTLFELRSLYAKAGFAIALGWDAYRDFARWRAPERLLEAAGLIVVPRASGADASGESAAAPQFLPPAWASRLIRTAPGEWKDESGRTVLELLPLRLPDISATRIWAESQWDLVPEPARLLLLKHLNERPHSPLAVSV
jgi:nicotinate-nucleotide adenylyltransferase